MKIDSINRFLAVFLIGFITLSFELLITRILAFVFWNHFVFIMVSLVLLGYGMSSTYVLILKSKPNFPNGNRFISINLIGTVLGMLISLITIKMVGAGYNDISLSTITGVNIFRGVTYVGWLSLLGVYIATVMPFFVLATY